MKSPNWRRRVLMVTLLGCLSFLLQGCPEKEGPMEKAGEKVDEAAKDAQRAVEDATD